MAPPRRLVLCVEGPGDSAAVPILAKRLLTDANAWDHLFLDDNPLVVGAIPKLTKDDGKEWLRYLKAAQKRKGLGAVLLIVDGDMDSVRREPFCARTFAARLAEWSRAVGGGTLFSVVCVIARMEYESWIIACAHRLAGLPLPAGADGVRTGTTPPAGDLETAPRNAKGWLGDHMKSGYKPAVHQALLTGLMVQHLDTLRERELRSFRRLESAISQLVEAVRSGCPMVSPGKPP